ncbi:MAG: CvpA family protein [Rhodospirillaceae bacterium]
MDKLGDLPVNVFDIGVITILLVSALLAYARGFVHEVLAIVGWIGAIFATFYSFPYLQPYARQLIPMDLAADLSAGVVIFVFTLVVLSMMTRAISKQVQQSALNALDRALGFLFGLARGALIVVLAYIGLELVMPKEKQPEFVRTARFMQLIEPAAKELVILLPDRLGGSGAGGQSSAKPDPGKVVLDIISPVVKSAPEENADGYATGQRQEMDRLIGNTQQKQ